jgi:hypothetical protein
MALNISFSSIMASLIFSSIGLWLLKESRKRGNITLSLIAIAMMAYTYFTTKAWADWGIGAALTYAAYYFWDR